MKDLKSTFDRMGVKLRYSLFFILFFISGVFMSGFSQVDKVRFNNATMLVNENNYAKALIVWMELEALHPDNAYIKFYLGLSYLEMDAIPMAIEKLEVAAKNVDIDCQIDKSEETFAPIVTYYFLAKALATNNEFKEALVWFQRYKYYLNLNDLELIYNVNGNIERCYNALILIDNPNNVEITNLGEVINSPYCDYAPVYYSSESKLLFTSHRENTMGGKKGKDGRFFSDIFEAKYARKKNEWSAPGQFEQLFNSEMNDILVGISPDGKMLLMCMQVDNNFDLYLSEQIKGKWSVPARMSKEINSPANETYGGFTQDGKTLYFVSDRPEGHGGKDIYRCKKEESGEWSRAMNLGPIINTALDEDSPFITADDQTLYFASKGHSTIGGYDIFTSRKGESGNLLPPENMGYPINTTANDLSYFPLLLDKFAFFASDRKGGLGGMDIYKVPISDQKPMYMNLSGILRDSISGEPVIQEIVLTVTDLSGNKVIAEPFTNLLNGKYSLSLPVGHEYVVSVNHMDYLPYQAKINATPEKAGSAIELNINLKLGPVSTREIIYNNREIVVGERVVVDNLQFDSGQSLLTEKADVGIQSVFWFLFDNPTLRIEISGHTSSDGESEANKSLSELRAKAITDALLKGGVDDNRITYQGFGSGQPIASNDTPEGKKKNERIEFKVTSKYSGESQFYVISSSEKNITNRQDIVYRVLLESSLDNSLNEDMMKKYSLSEQIFVDRFGGTYNYSVGSFSTYKEALEFDSFMKSSKGAKSRIIAYREKERIETLVAKIITIE